ncbi:hypothetical protein [Streptomyces sp. NPDC046805]|uniref:hypothetical protein n=1 Tax=Streptomyces sp. NPDC046805 TaxID=3155134 RepID=UPI0034107F55
MALLAALAGGAGGEAGREAWAALSSLIRRPFRRGGNAGAPTASSGEAELVRLAESPDDTARAHALSTALAVRAALDTEFQAGLRRWSELAESLDSGDIHNEITGGSFTGPVLQGRDFSGITFTTQPPPMIDPEQDTPPTSA